MFTSNVTAGKGKAAAGKGKGKAATGEHPSILHYWAHVAALLFIS